MVELVEHARVHRRHLLHGQIYVVEAVLEAVQQQAGHSGGDGRGVGGFRQLFQLQPLAAQTLERAEVYVVGQRAEAADDVKIGHTERSRVVVLLSDAEKRLEL